MRGSSVVGGFDEEHILHGTDEDIPKLKRAKKGDYFLFVDVETSPPETTATPKSRQLIPKLTRGPPTAAGMRTMIPGMTERHGPDPEKFVPELNRIYNSNGVAGVKRIKSESIDCVIIDPPYGINYFSNYYKHGNPHSPIVNDESFFAPLDELWRILKPTGAMFVFYSPKVPLLDERVKNVIVWVKNNWTAGDLYGDFGHQYELIAYMPKPEFKLHSKRYTNVWNFDRVSPDKLLHPTQKPEALLRRLVEVATNRGDVVLDCFAGSGTTAVAAKQLGRNFVGFELDKNYCDTANARLAQAAISALLGGG